MRNASCECEAKFFTHANSFMSKCWDDQDYVLSSKAKLAVNMLGKKAGDEFELPGAEDAPTQFARILSIEPLPDEIREWMKLPAGMQI